MAGERKNARVMLAAKKGGPAIDGELPVARGEIPQAEADALLVLDAGAAQANRQFMQSGVELVPEGRVRPQRQLDFGVGSAGGPLNLGHLRRIGHHALTLGADSYQTFTRGLGGVAQTQLDRDLAAGRIGINLHVIQPHQIGCPQFDPSDDAIPVALGIARPLMGIGFDRQTFVVHRNGELVRARRQIPAQFVFLRRAKNRVLANRSAIQPNLCVFRAFQKQGDAFAAPLVRYGDVTLIPARPLEAIRLCQSIRRALSAGRPLLVCVGRAWQMDRVGKFQRRQHSLMVAQPGLTAKEPPFTRQRDNTVSRANSRGTKNGERPRQPAKQNTNGKLQTSHPSPRLSGNLHRYVCSVTRNPLNRKPDGKQHGRLTVYSSYSQHGNHRICLWKSGPDFIWTALQDAARDTMIPEIREASWTAPALWRFARRWKVREISA